MARKSSNLQVNTEGTDNIRPIVAVYEQEQVHANGGKASDNDFPKGMLVMVYETKGSWCKISDTKNRWVHKNYLEELK